MASNHGSSPAAWTTVTITIVGFIVGGLALVLGRPAAVVASGGIVVAGLVLGKIMQLMGLGQRTFATSFPPAGRNEEGTGLAEPEGAR